MAARDDVPTIAEIAELTARLRRLSTAGRHADPAERAAFLADKAALIARIETADRQADAGRERRSEAAGAVADVHDALSSSEPRAEPVPLPDDWRLPPAMLDGIEERRTCPAEADDPAELRARLDELRHRIAGRGRAGSRAGATPGPPI